MPDNQNELTKNIEQNFAGLTSAFNTTFEMEDKDVQSLIDQTTKNLENIEEKKIELLNNKKEIALKDQSFIEDELRELIISTRAMLTKLEGEIKIGSKSGYYDSYARLASAATNQLRELRELDVAIIDASQKKNTNPINNGKRASIVMDANALIDLVDKARKGSQMNQIDATFSIVEEDNK